MAKRGECVEDDVGAQRSIARLIELGQLRANPQNPKARLKPDAALAASMKALGQLQPIVVRPLQDGAFEILAGHRRVAAARELGWPAVEAVAFRGDPALEGMVLLAENGVREDFRPLEEAVIVAALREKSTQEQVAAALGRSVRWVARRENLTKLSAKAIAATAAGAPLALWPPTWLEELALLAPKAQDEFLEQPFGDAFQSIEELRAAIRSKLRPLRLAPWKLDDPKLVRSVGACSTCPKNSCTSPALFGAEPGAPADAETAVCRDSICWDGKAEAFLKARLTELRKEHGPTLAVVEDRSPRKATLDGYGDGPMPELEGVKTLRNWEWSAGTKKHGRPALVAVGPRAGEVIYISTDKSGARGEAKNGEPAKPATLQERRDGLEKRRQYLVVAALAEFVESVEWSAVKGLPQFAACEDAEVLLQVLHRSRAASLLLRFQTFSDRGEEGAKFKATPRVIEELWQSVRDAVAHAIAERAKYRTGGDLPLADLKWFAEFVGFDLVSAAEQAEADAPEPRSWSKEAPAPAKRVRKAGAKAGAAR